MSKITPSPNSRAARAARPKEQPVKQEPSLEEIQAELDQMMEAAEKAESKKKSGRPAQMYDHSGRPIDDVDIAFWIERIKSIRGVNAREAARILHKMWKLPVAISPETLRVRGSKYRNEVDKPRGKKALD